MDGAPLPQPPHYHPTYWLSSFSRPTTKKMQGAAISFATPISLSAKPRKLAAARFNPLSPRHSERRRFTNGSFLSSPSASSSGRRLSPIVCSLKQSGWISSHVPGNSEAESYGVVVRAAEENTTAAGSPKSMVSTDTLVLGTLFGLWFLFNIYFNIYNKQVLKAFHYPLTVTLGQFAVGTVLVTLMWTLNLYKRPKISGSQGLNIKQIYTMSLLAALSFHAYQQVSYMILQRVSPVTHSVANCVKRVVLE